MTAGSEDDTFRKLRQSDFQVVFLKWMTWISDPLRPSGRDSNEILHAHGWTDREFSEEIKKRYSNKSMPL